jgi:hypothetical protein
MVIIRFPDAETEQRALGFLARHFSGKTYATGETIVPEAALAHLALEGIRFTVEGPATYDSIPRHAEAQRAIPHEQPEC